MALQLSGLVEGDLDPIAAFIAADNPQRAVSFIREIRTQLQVIGRQPLLYRLRSDIGEDARLASVGNYAVLFRVTDTGVVRIERVVYGGRDLPGVLEPTSQ